MQHLKKFADANWGLRIVRFNNKKKTKTNM